MRARGLHRPRTGLSLLRQKYDGLPSQDYEPEHGARSWFSNTSSRPSGPWISGVAALLLFAACNGDGKGNDDPTPPPLFGSGQFAYVINAEAANIYSYRVDGESGTLAPIGAPLATGIFPHQVNVDAEGRFVYVSNRESPFVSGYRINQDGTLAPMVPLPGSPVTGTDPTENQPNSSILDQTGQFLYVVAGPETGGLSTLRAYRVETTSGATFGLLTFIPGQNFTVGVFAHNMTISPNHRFLYVASIGTNEVHAFSRDTSTGALTRIGTVTGLPGAVDPQGLFLYVAERATNIVAVFQIGNNGVLTRIPGLSLFLAGVGPHALAAHPDGQTLYVANINGTSVSVFRIDPTTGALILIQTAPTGGDPHDVAVHPNGQFLYTADASFNQVSRFPINANGTLVASATTTRVDSGANGIGMTKLNSD